MEIQLSDHFTYKKLIKFVLPSIVMMIFTSIYGVVDGLFVSNFAGKTAFARGSKVTGTMPNNGSVKKTITKKADKISIAQGYHDGSGYVSIDEVEQEKLIADNIRSGITILGVTGSMSGTEDVTAQSRSVVPSTVEQTVTPEEGFNYLSSVTVAAIPYTESENAAGGITVTIGG